MKPRFAFAEDVRFTCSRCGDCCRTWNVMLGPGERERLEALDWRGRVDDLADLRPAVRVRQPGAGTRERLRRRDDGACVYLGAESQCLIHQHFGAEHKPLLCRLYPFGFYPMGERVGVDVSFACRAVSEGRGAPLAERQPEWTRLLTQDADRGRHQLRAGVPLAGELAWEIEHYLVGFLDDRSLPLIDRVRCVLQFTRIATTGDPATASAAKLRAAMARGIPVQVARQPSAARMDRTQRAIFYQWLFLCLNPPPFDLHERPRQEQEREAGRRVREGKRFLKLKGRPWVDNRELAASFADVARVDADVDELCAAPLETYLKAKILGQRFLVIGEQEVPVVEAVPKFLLALPMTLWTAQALAADRGAPRVEEADVRRALRLIDRTLGTLPTSALPRKQAEACDFIMLETDLVEAAFNEVVRGTP